MKNKTELDSLSPQKALEILIEGNKRFSNEAAFEHDTMDRVKVSKDGQFPFAVVVACMDSRVAPEIIFDQSIGDIFVIRVAGSVINEDVLGSIEYACQAVGSKCIMVLGHTKCGAVTGACQDVQLGNLTALLNKIKPAAQEANNGKDMPLAEWVEKTNENNIINSINTIKKDSPVLKKLVDEETILIQGAVYDVSSGKVHLLHKNE